LTLALAGTKWQQGIELQPTRVEKRLVIALPIRVYGMGSDGKSFSQEAHTLDITRDGARIAGLPPINHGETLGVQYGEEKSRYKVVWVAEPRADQERQIGIQVMQAGPAAWHKILEATPEEGRWVDSGQPRHPSFNAGFKAPSTSAPPAPAGNISERVGQATEELQVVEKLIESGAVDGRILQDFREAVNHVRQTSWAVQRWLELRDQKQDPYSAVDLLVRERIRCATQLNRELGHDIESSEVDTDTEGLASLQMEVDTLWRLLNRIMGKLKVDPAS
jgi:hypothetical protein